MMTPERLQEITDFAANQSYIERNTIDLWTLAFMPVVRGMLSECLGEIERLNAERQQPTLSGNPNDHDEIARLQTDNAKLREALEHIVIVSGRQEDRYENLKLCWSIVFAAIETCAKEALAISGDDWHQYTPEDKAAIAELFRCDETVEVILNDIHSHAEGQKGRSTPPP